MVFIIEQQIKAYIFLHDREHYVDSLICINKTLQSIKIKLYRILFANVSEGVICCLPGNTYQLILIFIIFMF